MGTFLGGSLSDRQSARTATLISMLGSALLLVSIVYLRSYPLLLIAIVLVSAVSQIYRPAAQALITEFTPPERTGAGRAWSNRAITNKEQQFIIDRELID